MVDLHEQVLLDHSSATTHPGKDGPLHRKRGLITEARWESCYDPKKLKLHGSILISGNTSPNTDRQAIALLHVDVRDFRGLISSMLAANRAATVKAFCDAIIAEDD